MDLCSHSVSRGCSGRVGWGHLELEFQSGAGARKPVTRHVCSCILEDKKWFCFVLVLFVCLFSEKEDTEQATGKMFAVGMRQAISLGNGLNQT